VPRRRRPPAAAREEILREARALLEEEGLRGVSLRKLAARIGVTTGQLYHHFLGKREICRVIALRGFLALDEALAPADQLSDPAARVRHVARAYLEFSASHPALYDLMLDPALVRIAASQRLAALLTPEELEARDRSFGHLLAAVEAGIAAGTFAAVTPFEGASLLWTTLHGTAGLQRRGWTRDADGAQLPDVDAFLERLPDLLVRALSEQ